MGVAVVRGAPQLIEHPQKSRVSDYLNAVKDYTSPVTGVITYLFFQTLTLMYPQWFVDKLHIVWKELVIQFVTIRSKINENRLNRQLEEKEGTIRAQAKKIAALEKRLNESEKALQGARDKFDAQSKQLLTTTQENHVLRSEKEELSQLAEDLKSAIAFLKSRPNQAEGDAAILSQLEQLQRAHDAQKLPELGQDRSEAAQVYLKHLRELYQTLNTQIEKMDKNSSNSIILTSVRDNLIGLMQEVAV